MKKIDSLHIVCAIKARADYFLERLTYSACEKLNLSKSYKSQTQSGSIKEVTSRLPTLKSR